jgi:hypothetical protein
MITTMGYVFFSQLYIILLASILLMLFIQSAGIKFVNCEISLLIFYSQREVPSSNIALHSAHCARNLQKCEHCGDMVARKLMDEHYDENHAPVYF